MRIAVAQMNSTSDIAANLRTARQLCASAREQQCTVLFLPEAFAYIGDDRTMSVDIRSDRTDVHTNTNATHGVVMETMRELARSYDLWISMCVPERAGVDVDVDGAAESTRNNGKRYNSHVILDRGGKLYGDAYRKIHLFDADVPGGAVLRESDWTARGEALRTYDVEGVRMGASICYDVRFPDMYQALRFEEKCDLIVVPSAFTKKTGAAHWETLLRARAIETQCYVVAAAQCGEHGNGRASYGHAMIIDPWGTVVARIENDEIGIAVANVSLEHVDEVRRAMPLESHRQSVRKVL